jgi:LPS O-antigen subunit length determinant protein (WzzB/FepE family)
MEIENASSLLEYLELKTSSIASADIRKQIGNLMLVSIGKMALAERSYEFAYEVLDKPNFPIQKTSPSRLFIMVFFIIFGFLIAISRAVIHRKI